MQFAPQETRTYFLTTITAQRRRLFQITTNTELMISHLQENRLQGRFQLHSFVVMPDHVHVLLTPAPDVSLEKTMQFIKGGFSFKLKSKLDVWERGFNEAQIKTVEKFGACRTYIEQNPVRKGLVERPEELAYSSAGRSHLVDPCPPWLTARG